MSAIHHASARTVDRRGSPARRRPAQGRRQGHADHALRLGQPARSRTRRSSTRFTGARADPPRGRSPCCSTTRTNSCYEAAVSLTERKLLVLEAHSRRAADDDRSTSRSNASRRCLRSPEFKAALKKQYGIDDTRLVMVDIWSAGNYGSEEDRTRRLARPLCFLRSDPTDNGYARPIEGIAAGRRSEHDAGHPRRGIRPLAAAAAAGNYAADRVHRTCATDIKPLEITQPEGPSFEVEGNQVRWQKWSFVIGFNAREGLTLHHLRYQRRRPRTARSSIAPR